MSSANQSWWRSLGLFLLCSILLAATLVLLARSHGGHSADSSSLCATGAVPGDEDRRASGPAGADVEALRRAVAALGRRLVRLEASGRQLTPSSSAEERPLDDVDRSTAVPSNEVPRLPRSGSPDGSRNEEAADGPYAVDEASEEERALVWSRAARVALQDHLEMEGTDGRWTADREGALRSVLVSAALGGPSG